MRSMLNEFYDFIAKRINSYFQIQSDQGLLGAAESFCLKLDDDEMVNQVRDALNRLVCSNGNKGTYNYSCMSGETYSTFTLKVKDTEVIVAAQDERMTSDFLGASLRNAANEELKPLLMITAHPIDSALSGSRDMSAKGMPFYSENLIEEIKSMISTSSLLTNVEKCILDFELNRREDDVFSDKNSLYEYKELLAIMSSGKIDRNIFPGFRLFFINGKTEFENLNDRELKKEIKKNNDLFEKIDRSVHFGNIDTDLSADFDEKFIKKLNIEKNQNLDDWSMQFSYKDIASSLEKKEKQKDSPLEIGKDDIVAYGDFDLNRYNYDAELFIRNEGSQKSKRRKKNILIFNSNKSSEVHLRFDCNIKLPREGISSDIDSYEKEGKSIIFKFASEPVSYHQIKLSDDNNKITYIFKICILEIFPQYLIPTIKTSFFINYKKSKGKSSIKLVGVGSDLSFNQGAEFIKSEKLQDNTEYTCDYKTRLNISSSEEDLSNFGNGNVNIKVDFSGALIAFDISPDESKSQEITGKRIFKEKNSNESSFTISSDLIIQRESQEYFVKGLLGQEIYIEKIIIDNHIVTGYLDDYREEKYPYIEEKELILSSSIQESYVRLLDVFAENNTTPTLAYWGEEEIKKAAINYLNAFCDEFSSIKEKMPLSIEQQNALILGTLSMGENVDEILLTPFHPINVAYQLNLLNEYGIGKTSYVVIDRLNSIYLLPYLQRKKRVYKVSDQLYSMEWKHYAPVENRKYMGGRKYVPKLVEDKIDEFTGHFRYIFDEISNRVIQINLINMGDCSEILRGIATYYCHAIKKIPDIEKLLNFEIRIYTNDFLDNAFNFLKDRNELKRYLAEQKLSIDSGIAMSDLEGILARNVKCYFIEDLGQNYGYAHITFYEMESEITSEMATMDQIATGVSLGGILSGVPSSQYGQKYRTGFGSKYASKTSLEKIAELYNALMQVSDTGNPYQPGVGISTQIDSIAENKMDDIYAASNWVVFVDPKVDLDFFCEKEAKSDLLIIHYSDQYTSSSGYDAITVTHKSKQYSKVIQDYMNEKGVTATQKDVAEIINLFNAINGDWLLRLVSSKKVVGVNKDSMFSREKISIVAAIKLMLAYLKHPDILWVPISMEEMLRVSGGAGLSQSEGVLSAKNLGFEKGPTSDDLLFVGIQALGGEIQVYFYPTEVKTGINSNAVISKAFEQAAHTADGLSSAMNPADEDTNSIMYKVNRNFMMQLVINSCKKMQVYHVDDSQNWDIVLDLYRERLLNEEYVISEDIRKFLGKGSVLSFKKGLSESTTSVQEGAINFIELPEDDEYGLILKEVSEIAAQINIPDSKLQPLGRMNISKMTPKSHENNDLKNLNDASLEEDTPEPCVEQDALGDNTNEYDRPNRAIEMVAEHESQAGIIVKFGTNLQNGEEIYWCPNNTNQVFHTNTGIIGTMGTGKTQFTKSLIAQLHSEQDKNISHQPIGILIFDYKGDYNNSKIDFVNATNAKVLQPYQLPFNPLALTKGPVPKPLLPIHTANAFKDTLSKVYSLGPKQQDQLFQCILKAYQQKGIRANDSSTWNLPAPTFETVYSIYAEDEEIKKNDSLAAAMNKLHQFQVFEGDSEKTRSLFELLTGVVVIDLSGYDSDIQSLVIAITLDLFYSQMQSAGSSVLQQEYRQLTKFILVDEADNFMSQGFPSLKKILKEGREFGVGTILSTQFLKHFGSGDDDYAKYILTWVVHNVADLKTSDVSFVFNTEAKSIEELNLYNRIKQLQKHNSVVKIGTNKPVFIEDLPFWKLNQSVKK